MLGLPQGAAEQVGIIENYHSSCKGQIVNLVRYGITSGESVSICYLVVDFD